jgi:ABC-2 type transport system permease protein
MLSLIWKDLIIQKRSWLTVVFLPVFMLIAFSNEPEAAYVAGALAVTYVLIAGACVYDDKNNSAVLWCSLPIPRRTIVLGKYFAALIFMVVGIVIVAIYGIVLQSFSLPILTVKDISGIFFTTASFMALYFPIYFKFGYAKSRYFSIIIYVLMFMSPKLAIEQFKNNPNLLAWLQSMRAGLLVALVAVLLLIISYFISVVIYQNKDIG